MIDILPLIRDYSWLVDQYNTQEKTATQIALELGINKTTVGTYLRKQNIATKYNHGFSYNSISWIKSIMELENIHIQHAVNGGEYKIPGTPYRADGYNKETNTIYEFYGDYWHGNPNVYDASVINKKLDSTMKDLYQQTMARQTEIESLGYNFVVVWESDWKKMN